MLNLVWELCGVTLEGRAEPRLSDVSLEIPAGVTAVMGASGAGKSSLLELLTGLFIKAERLLSFDYPIAQFADTVAGRFWQR